MPGAGGKEPLTVHGFKDATADPEAIRRWWNRWPGANLGVATGTPGPDVLDIDVRADGSGYPALNRLIRAGLAAGHGMIVRTPSGGAHLYYAGSAQRCGSLPGLHLDFRGRGGYVIAPGSALADGRAWRLEQDGDASAALDWSACRAPLAPASASASASAAAPGLARRGLAGLAAWVERQREGNRNAGLFWAACRAAEEGLNPWPLAEVAVRTGLPEAEARRTVASAVRRSQ